MKIGALGAKTSWFDIKIPSKLGEYQLIADLDKVDGRIVRSLRDIKVARPNLALGKPATASSFEAANDKTLDAASAVDGKMDTRWSSEFSDPQWIQVDLGAPVMIDSIKLCWEAAHGKSYVIEVSTNGKDWSEVYSTDDGKDWDESIRFAPVTTRWVRMRGIARDYLWILALRVESIWSVK